MRGRDPCLKKRNSPAGVLRRRGSPIRRGVAGLSPKPLTPYHVFSFLYSGAFSPRLLAPLQRSGEPQRLLLLRLWRTNEEAFRKAKRLQLAQGMLGLPPGDF